MQEVDHLHIKRITVWRETLVVGKFGELSAKLPLAK